MHFCAYSEAEQGHYANAKKWCDMLVEHVTPHVAHMQMLEAFYAVPYEIEVRFAKWDDILSEPTRDPKATPIAASILHFARGMAYAGKGDSDGAGRERAEMIAIVQTMPADLPYAMVNKAHDVMKIATNTLDAMVAAQAKQLDKSEKILRETVVLQDKMNYIEPPDWLLNTREELGNILLAKGDAAGAEKVFREDLERHPRGGRSLLGLSQALDKQGKTYEADLVRAQFRVAWKNADTKLMSTGF
jgi:tetratricopeptide (TPR) repeat protein